MNCRICNCLVNKVYHGTGSRTNSTIPIYKCDICNAYFTYPDIVDYSSPSNMIIDYYKKYQTEIEIKHNTIFHFIKSRFLTNKGKFLDIGSGIGFSLGVAEDLGWDALGIEPSLTLADYSKNQMGKNVIKGFFSEELIINNKDLAIGDFNYILIDNVLEHVDNPTNFIKLAQRLLTKDGVIVVAVPQVDWFRLFLIKFPFVRNIMDAPRLNLFYDLEQHINYFSRKAIKNLLNNLEIDGELKLLEDRFHHSKILNGKISSILKFETGYYFIKKI